jgi:cytoskeletal protein CcmA (bactofilin family)
MKLITRLSILVLFVAAFLGLPATVHAQTPDTGDKVIFGGTYTLKSDESLDGSLIIFGGAVSLEKGSKVGGDVVLTGGSLEVSGTIDGSITAIGGTVNLNDSAVVDGDINSVGAILKKADGAKVEGNISNQAQGDFHLPVVPAVPGAVINNFDFDPIGNFLWAIFKAIVVAALAALIVMFAPKPAERVASAVTTQPVQSGLFGLLTAVVAPGIILILSITLILIPLALIGALLLGVAVLFGWIAIGMEVGKKMADMFKTTWTPPVSAGLGTLVLGLILSAAQVIPCIGWIFPSIVAIFAVGAVLITRFGTRWPTSWNTVSYPPAGPVVPASSEPTPSRPAEEGTTTPPEKPTDLP